MGLNHPWACHSKSALERRRFRGRTDKAKKEDGKAEGARDAFGNQDSVSQAWLPTSLEQEWRDRASPETMNPPALVNVLQTNGAEWAALGQGEQ